MLNTYNSLIFSHVSNTEVTVSASSCVFVEPTVDVQISKILVWFQMQHWLESCIEKLRKAS